MSQTEMKLMTPEARDELADMQLRSLEVAKTPVTDFDVAIKSYVDSKFNTAVNSATTAVSDLIADAPEQLNTLKEIATALGDNANLATVLTQPIANVSASVTTEATNRSSADATEKTERVAADDLLRTSVSNEETARYDADQKLDGKITTEATARFNADTTERNDRVAADAALHEKFDDEKVIVDGALQSLAQNKFDVSPYYSGGSESPLKISPDSHLYIGNLWRITANSVGGYKRLEFQYSPDGLEANFKTAVPFIRPSI